MRSYLPLFLQLYSIVHVFNCCMYFALDVTRLNTNRVQRTLSPIILITNKYKQANEKDTPIKPYVSKAQKIELKKKQQQQQLMI